VYTDGLLSSLARCPELEEFLTDTPNATNSLGNFTKPPDWQTLQQCSASSAAYLLNGKQLAAALNQDTPLLKVSYLLPLFGSRAGRKGPLVGQSCSCLPYALPWAQRNVARIALHTATKCAQCAYFNHTRPSVTKMHGSVRCTAPRRYIHEQRFS
jgi:hypothetical protein